jgi:SAM-dependent methyltransferase
MESDSKVNSCHSRRSLVGPPDLWDMKRDFQIQFLLKQGLTPEHRLLDFGCGVLRGGIPIIHHLLPGQYVGIEVRRELLVEAERELAENGLAHKNPNLLLLEEGQVFRSPSPFDFIWVFAVLIHLDDSKLNTALNLLHSLLAPNGAIYATVNVGSKPEGAWQGFPIVFREFDFYHDIFQRNGLLVRDMGSLIEHGHQHPRLTLAEQSNQRMLIAKRIE